MQSEQQKPQTTEFASRATALLGLATSLVAVVYICDCFGAHIRSKGEPGWWEYSMAALWTGYALYWWRKVARHYRLWRDQQP